jgi:hypothetical protein
MLARTNNLHVVAIKYVILLNMFVNLFCLSEGMQVGGS